MRTMGFTRRTWLGTERLPGEGGRGMLLRLGAATLVLSLLALLLSAAPSSGADTSPFRGDQALTATVVGDARAGWPIAITVTGAPLLAPGQTVSATWMDPGTGIGATSYTTSGDDGTARIVLRAWKSTTVTVRIGSAETELVLDVQPQRRPVANPVGAPAQRPSYRVNEDPAGLGSGANPSVTRIDSTRRASMTGISWRPGCVPLSSLREVQVNYWGVDGYRHRGTLIARDDTTHSVVRSFTLLYESGYRLTSMHPVDAYGLGPSGVGADDFASMTAGNTSMFNCRYQYGKEQSRVWSPHATGRALDINPWENPYLSRNGLVPNAWWYAHRTGSPMAIRRMSVVTRILIANGWIWGERFDDLHHFDFAG